MGRQGEGETRRLIVIRSPVLSPCLLGGCLTRFWCADRMERVQRGRNSAVECSVPNADVAGSNPVARFIWDGIHANSTSCLALRRRPVGAVHAMDCRGDLAAADVSAACRQRLSRRRCHDRRGHASGSRADFGPLRNYPIGMVALTHCHPDHQGLAKIVCEQRRIPLACHEADVPVMEGRAPMRPNNWIVRLGHRFLSGATIASTGYFGRATRWRDFA